MDVVYSNTSCVILTDVFWLQLLVVQYSICINIFSCKLKWWLDANYSSNRSKRLHKPLQQWTSLYLKLAGKWNKDPKDNFFCNTLSQLLFMWEKFIAKYIIDGNFSCWVQVIKFPCSFNFQILYILILEISLLKPVFSPVDHKMKLSQIMGWFTVFKAIRHMTMPLTLKKYKFPCGSNQSTYLY